VYLFYFSFILVLYLHFVRNKRNNNNNNKQIRVTLSKFFITGDVIMHWWLLSVCPSVRLSVPCLILSRERKDVGSWKLEGGRTWHGLPVTPFRGRKVKGQGHQARLTPWPKISHVFRTGRPMNFKLGIRMEYDERHHRHARWRPTGKLWVAAASHHLQGAGAYCGGPITGQAAQLVISGNSWQSTDQC